MTWNDLKANWRTRQAKDGIVHESTETTLVTIAWRVDR
jgi:hypothetical protein